MERQTPTQLHHQGYTPDAIYRAVESGVLIPEQRRQGGRTWWELRGKNGGILT